jgi:DNA mismatch repair ATPase MutS
VVELNHPLIDEPVSNTLNLTDRSALIAGPNMAGKTSFVRTIGIALVLGQTLNFCLARQAVLPRAVVRSAIRREDKLADGESYFFSEIKQILEFIRVDKQASFHVFLIDEIFRGTNTIERIASSVAVLRHLARDHMVFVTTHDFKLQELLADSFDMHHFGDRVLDGEYGFDYLIRPGPVQTRNAIKLLELSGYPASITREAEVLAEGLSA